MQPHNQVTNRDLQLLKQRRTLQAETILKAQTNIPVNKPMTLRAPFSVCLALAALSASAQPDVPEKGAVLAELFTSQSCSSCPTAEETFNHLAETDGVVAIQWHVDYWDQLVHGRAGNWKDPFSSASNTKRQRDYNYALRGTASVYTPQAVIGGVSETVGSRVQTVKRLIARAPIPEAKIAFSTSNTGYTVSIDQASGGKALNAEVILVTLLAHDETSIAGGENKGRKAVSRNVVVDANTLGAWGGMKETYRADLTDAGYSCAIIVQESHEGRVLGASYCPP